MTGRNWSWAVWPTSARSAAESLTPGISIRMLLRPSREMAGSPTPARSMRFRRMFTASLILSDGVPFGAVRTTLNPPWRSRPSLGFMPVTRMVPSSPATTRNTRTTDVTNRRVAFTSPTLTDGMRSQKIRPVDDEAELAIEELRGAPAHRHALEEDLEVLHDLAHRGIYGQFQGQRPLVGVKRKDAGLGCEVHPVVDVEGLRVLVANP